MIPSSQRSATYRAKQAARVKRYEEALYNIANNPWYTGSEARDAAAKALAPQGEK